jgi:hypothetical protein
MVQRRHVPPAGGRHGVLAAAQVLPSSGRHVDGMLLRKQAAATKPPCLPKVHAAGNQGQFTQAVFSPQDLLLIIAERSSKINGEN